MFGQTTLEEFKCSSENAGRSIVYREFPCDDLTPIQAFLSLNAQEGAVLLESAVKDQELGRYSLIAVEPFAEFRSKGKCSEYLTRGECDAKSSDPYGHLREVVQAARFSRHPNHPPMVGGAIGFATYDAVRLFEEIPDRHTDLHQLPDLLFFFHAVHIAFDHSRGTVLISVHVERTDDPQNDYSAAVDKIDEVHGRLKAASMRPKSPAYPLRPFEEEMDDAAFCSLVKKAQEHIFKGDAFQIVLSRSFTSAFPGDPFDVYRALRMTNPSPFMFYIQTKEFAIAGASPERLVRLQKGKLQTMPIAGTRPRIHGEEDKIALELLQDPKEDAEHMMLVDLGRNDLGIVSKIGSVKVKELKVAKYFPHVIHLVSQVESEIAEGFDPLDVLKAVFPAGTLTGAPKIRAMQIIDALESSRRGIYGGAICSIDSNGDFDSCIAIRTALIQKGTATVRAGAGIVFDSDPQKEAEETRAKAKGVIQAIHLALEGVL